MAGLTYANQVGAARGMNQAAPGTFIPEDFVRWSQDILFDRVGLLRRRPPFETVTLYASDGTTIEQPQTANERCLGLISTLNPDNDPVFGIVITDGSTTKIYFYDKNFVFQNLTDLGFATNTDAILFSNPALNGGSFIGILDNYGTISTGNNDHYLYYWRGGMGLDGSTKTCNLVTTNVPIAVGSGTTVETYTNEITGTWSQGEITKGMFAVADFAAPYTGGTAEENFNAGQYYLGVVKEATTSQVYLEKNTIRIAAKISAASKTGVTVKFYNVRDYIHNHGRGLITYDAVGTTVTSGPIGSFGEGHFSAAGLDTNWALYRQSDGAWLGNVASVPDNETIVLSGTLKTNIKMTGDEYVARKYQTIVGRPIVSNSTPAIANAIKQEYPGIFNTTYAGYQWFGNGGLNDTQSSITFSSAHDPESVDLSLDASDSIIVPATQQMRGMAASVSGLLIFFENKTYLLRGNSRFNFSLEELYPEGCLSAESIVEFGGGVFWASKKGIMLFDGSTVRNLTGDNLGSYYTDSVKGFNSASDTVYGFVYKDYLFMHFTSFNSTFQPVRYEPIYAESIDSTEAIKDYEAQDWDPDFEIDDFDPKNNVPIYWDYIKMYATGGSFSGIWSNSPPNFWGQSGLVWGPSQPMNMVFSVYLPTNAITTFSNFGFKGFASYDNVVEGVRGFAVVDAVNPTYNVAGDTVNGVSPRLITLDSMLDTKNDHTVVEDSELCENAGQQSELYYKGPDFYLQTKHYTFGDPTLRKWFRQLFLNLYLIDGGLRLDIVDNEDKDLIDIEKKKHRNWEIFVEDLYNWDEVQDVILPKILSPNRSTWKNLEDLGISWYEFSDAQYERRKKKFSWRYPSMGFRLYQMNNFRPRNYQTAKKPHTVEIDSWSIGFKPMRQTRV